MFVLPWLQNHYCLCMLFIQAWSESAYLATALPLPSFLVLSFTCLFVHSCTWPYNDSSPWESKCIMNTNQDLIICLSSLPMTSMFHCFHVVTMVKLKLTACRVIKRETLWPSYNDVAFLLQAGKVLLYSTFWEVK